MADERPILKTIKRLHAIADALEMIEGDFPGLSWHQVTRDTHPFNPPVDHTDDAGMGFTFDLNNIGRATAVHFCGLHRDEAVAVFAHDPIPSITVMRLRGMRYGCLAESRRTELIEIASQLPEPLRLEVYRRFAWIRRNERAKKRAAIEHLQGKIRELEAPQ